MRNSVLCFIVREQTRQSKFLTQVRELTERTELQRRLRFFLPGILGYSGSKSTNKHSFYDADI